jgi:hypothetical protein
MNIKEVQAISLVHQKTDSLPIKKVILTILIILIPITIRSISTKDQEEHHRPPVFRKKRGREYQERNQEASREEQAKVSVFLDNTVVETNSKYTKFDHS